MSQEIIHHELFHHYYDDENEEEEQENNDYYLKWNVYDEINYLKFKPSIKIICVPIFDVNGFILFVTQTGNVFLKGELANYKFEKFTKIKELKNIKFAASGEDFIVLIDNENKLFGCGAFLNHFALNKYYKNCSNENNGEFSTKFKEFKFKINENIKSLICGPDIIIIVTENNKILFTGNSLVLNGNSKYTTKFKFIENKLNIKDLKCGYYHSILLDYNGDIYGTGLNENGQLGLQDFTMKLKTFQKLNVNFKVKKIMTTSHGTLLLNNYNEIYGSGYISYNNRKNNMQPMIDFTKINLNIENIYSIKFLTSNKEMTFILVNKTKFYYFVNLVITKLEIKFKKEWKYYFLEKTEDGVYIIGSDFKINRKIYSLSHSFKLILQQALQNKSFTDIEINTMIDQNDNFEIKKRNNIQNNNKSIKKRKF
ncbi:hypothetical protein ABK040_010385 [Willaertia magna]